MKSISNEHWQYQELIPWYVNGTLDESEMDHFSQHLKGCEDCRQEVESELAFARRYSGKAFPGFGDSHRIDTGLSRLLERLETAGEAPPEAGPARSRLPLVLGLAATVVVFCLISVLWVVPGGQIYRTLTSAPAKAEGTILQVMFEPQALERDVREVLTASGATIVSGPSAQGVYRIALPADSDEKEIIARLKHHPATRMLEEELR